MIVNFPKENLTNRGEIDVWVKEQVDALNRSFTDGINIDFESQILPNETKVRDGFTYLVQELSTKMKADSPSNMVCVKFDTTL